MLVVIQCAAGKQHYAGHLRTLDDRKVMFVAQPSSAPADGDWVYARPDDISDRGESWRTVLERCNAEPGENPLGLLPAWRLYRNPAYEPLCRRIGPERLYILSAGWGLVRADYLTPNYDITFSKAGNVPKFKRRGGQDVYNDFWLPSGVSDPIAFFGGRDYLPLFTKLTARAKGTRTVFYAGRGVTAPGCKLQRFGHPFTNWHYQCAKGFLDRLRESGVTI
ncbi:MAG: hypothetical protein OXF74_06700 [Rhodobacteraceae bacterium]|nr:hypothetical protein [Paracoccaceae bacterium]